MFGKWTTKEEVFHVVYDRTNTMNYASFPEYVVSPNTKIRFPLRFAAAIVCFRISRVLGCATCWGSLTKEP